MIQVRIQRQLISRSIGIWVMEERSGKFFVAEPSELTFKDHGGGAFLLPEPTFSLSLHDFDALRKSVHEELVGAGIEDQAVANASELRATKEHRDDLRAMLFHQLGVKA